MVTENRRVSGATLPPLHSLNVSHGSLRAELCKKWGLAKAPTISAGGGDNMMAAIGTGNVRAGVVTASLGTSGTLFACSTVPIVDPQGEVAAFCDSTDNWLPLICTLNLTLVTEHVRKLFGWDYASGNRSPAPIRLRRSSAVAIPRGERTGFAQWHGRFHGLTLAIFTVPHRARRVWSSRWDLVTGSRFRALGMHPRNPPDRQRATVMWRQMCADVFGVPIVCLQSGERPAWANHSDRMGGKEQGSIPSGEVCDRLVQVDENSRNPGRGQQVCSGRLRRTGLIRNALAASKLI